jgi:tryptophan halogenase
MLVPESLTYKRELFATTGRIAMLEHETFLPASWLAIYAGLHIWPQRYEPIVEIFGGADLGARLKGMRESIRRSVETLPTHSTFLNEMTS